MKRNGPDERLRDLARRLAADPRDLDVVRDLCDEVSADARVPAHARPSTRTATDLVNAGMRMGQWARGRGIEYPENEEFLRREEPQAFRVNFSENSMNAGAAGAEILCWCYDAETRVEAAVWVQPDGRAGFLSGGSNEVLRPELTRFLQRRQEYRARERREALEQARLRRLEAALRIPVDQAVEALGDERAADPAEVLPLLSAVEARGLDGRELASLLGLDPAEWGDGETRGRIGLAWILASELSIGRTHQEIMGLLAGLPVTSRDAAETAARDLADWEEMSPLDRASDGPDLGYCVHCGERIERYVGRWSHEVGQFERGHHTAEPVR